MMDALTNNPIADPGMTIPVWNGRTLSDPGLNTRLIFEGGLYNINEWQKPSYRLIKNVKPKMDVFERFLSFILKHASEREVFLDWLSWCLQNEADKPSWAIFLFSEKHGTGKSTLASIVKKLFGEANSSEQQGIKPIISWFNKPILLKSSFMQKKSNSRRTPMTAISSRHSFLSARQWRKVRVKILSRSIIGAVLF